MLEENGEGGIEVYRTAAPTLEKNRLVRNKKGGVVVGEQARPILRRDVYEDNEVGAVVLLNQAAPRLEERAGVEVVDRRDGPPPPESPSKRPRAPRRRAKEE